MTAVYAQISDRYAQFIDGFQAQFKVSKKQILEEALELLMMKQKEKNLEQAYKAMGEDNDYLLEMSQNAEKYLTL